MIIELLLPTNDQWSYTTTLDGVLYQITGIWIDDATPNCQIGIYDVNGNAIETGIRLVEGVRFCFRHRNPIAPPGILALALSSPLETLANRQDFVEKATFYYEPAV